MTRIEKYLIIAVGIMTLAACAKTVPSAFPKSIDYELANQRHIAARSIARTSSYNQYSAFAAANTGEHVEITGARK